MLSCKRLISSYQGENTERGFGKSRVQLALVLLQTGSSQYLSARRALSWVPTSSWCLHPASFPLFPWNRSLPWNSWLLPRALWVPDLGHKARVRNVGAVWRYDLCLWFIVLESRGIWLKPVSLGCSSCRKNGLGVTRLAAACLCFSTYQKLLGDLKERWKISWLCNGHTEKK